MKALVFNVTMIMTQLYNFNRPIALRYKKGTLKKSISSLKIEKNSSIYLCNLLYKFSIDYYVLLYSCNLN